MGTGARRYPPGARARPGQAPAYAAQRPNASRWRRRHLAALLWSPASPPSSIGYTTTDAPDPNADFQTATTVVYYNDGKTQLGRFAVQNRTAADLRARCRTA